MANIKSQKKRILTNAKRAERNKSIKSEMKGRLRQARATIGEDGNAEDVRAATARLDSAARRNVIHKNAAARQKSRLMKKVNAAAKG